MIAQETSYFSSHIVFVPGTDIYYLNFPKDAPWIKLYGRFLRALGLFLVDSRFVRYPTVVLIFLLELTFTILTTIAGWRMVGSGWGDPYHLYYMEKLQTGTPVMCALVTTLVHGFYCWRIYVLTGNRVKYVITGTIMSVRTHLRQSSYEAPSC